MRLAFSLAEAFVALLIASIILGLSAPLVSKTIKHDNLNAHQMTVINERIERIERDTIPAGMIAFFNGDCPPEGWTRVDNSWNGRYIKISGVYNVCDIYGENSASGICNASVVSTPRYASGVMLGDTIRNITGDFGNMDRYFGNPSTVGAFYVNGQLGRTSPDGDRLNAARLYFDASRVVPTGVENQPKTIVLNACIKN